MNSLPDDRPATGITYYDVSALAFAYTTLFVKTHATMYTVMWTTMYPMACAARYEGRRTCSP